MKYYATKGTIPKPGEIWLPVGDKTHLMMIHLFDIEHVKPFIPDELKIKAVLPGKTLGLVFMTSMGPDSTLPYHEFIIAPALVKANKRAGFYVAHIFVDNEKSQAGGRNNFGLDKQMAQFGKLPIKLGGKVFSILGDKLVRCNNIFKAKFGLTKVEYSIPQDSLLQLDLVNMGFTKPIFTIMGEEMTGFMGEDTEVVAFLPDR